jgi:hypothetical protein
MGEKGEVVSISKIVCELWLCENCTLVHANGECGEIHAESCPALLLENFDFDSGKPYPDACDCGACEPLSAIPEGHSVTAGIFQEQHDDSCPNRNCSNSSEWIECDCGKISHSTSQCDGCGTYLHGPREAHTLWKD